MTERDFYDQVRKGAQPLRWERIENTCLPGQPDTICSYKGQSVEVEFKVCSGNTLALETFQISWFIRNASTGGRAKILARKGDCMLTFSCKQLPMLIRNGIIRIRGKQSLSLPPASPALAAHRKQVFEESPIFKTVAPFDWVGLKEALFS